MTSSARHLGDVEARDSRGVGERLAVVADDPREDLERVGLHDVLVMLGAEALGDQPGLRQLVVLVVGEADRERPHRLGRMLRHRRDDGRGVDAAGEERAQGHVGDHPPAHGAPDLAADLLVPLREAGEPPLAEKSRRQ